jgi:tricorn protease
MILLATAVLASMQVRDGFDAGPSPLLLQHPTMNATTIAFKYADGLWTVPKTGGLAVRLTAGHPITDGPFYSPDGKLIAFSANYDGNIDVYVIPAEGGNPKRLTSHPAPDGVEGWTPDGQNVLYASSMLSNTDYPRLFTVPVRGGFPTPLPLPSGSSGSYSADGKKLAYVPTIHWESAWKRYRGGQTFPIWIADLATSRVTKIPRENTNDSQPMWVGNRIYYLTDKLGPVGLNSYDTSTGAEREEIKGEGFDVKSATAGPGGIVYEKFGSIRIYDPAARESHVVPIEVRGDFPEVRAEFKDIHESIDGASISPSGARVAVSTRGWVMTVPAKKGDARLLDETQGVHRRAPAWSPDGKTVAYITDVGGNQQLALFDGSARTEKRLDLGDEPGFYYAPVWSPDSSAIAYIDNKRNLWMIDVKTGQNTKIDSEIYDNPGHAMIASWSPDSRWIAWARDLENHLNAVFLYSLDTKKVTQITDGLADADDPTFDRDGRLLYFHASTQVGQASSWLDISNYNNLNAQSSVYAVVLRKDLPNPLQPESDEEAAKVETPMATLKTPGSGPGGKPADKPKFGIDLDGIESRIISLPLPPALYSGLVAGPAGSLFALAMPPRTGVAEIHPFGIVSKFSFSDRKVTPFASAVRGIQVTPDGAKALILGPLSVSIVSTAAPAPPGEGLVDVSSLRVKIDPKVEWAAMYREIWRNERLLFYSPTINGLNVDMIERRYQPFLANISSREDLNYLFVDMLGELCVGHEFPGGGDIPPHGPSVAGGLLGADYSFDANRYRLTRIYTGERWNPGLYAPLAQPGVNAKMGEYVLAIDGKDLTSSTDIYDALEGKAGKQVRIKLGPHADGSDSREVTVVPVASEYALRSRAWEEDNRRYVEKMTAGRGGYVHVPDTNIGGWTAFNRYYYAQVGKDGMVVDERFNHGGLINDFMVREMQKPLDAAFQPRHGKPWPTPGSSIYGPKVMLINEMAGSGGDMFPWLFRHEKVGRLIGKRTWGGLIAAFGFPTIDGGRINSPDIAFFNTSNGTWDVENWGTPPDEDVDLDPYAWRQGHDSQLDAGIAELNKQLAKYSPPKLQHPPYPDRTKVGVRY